MADNIPAVDGISDADVARVLLYQGQRSVHAPLTGVVSADYVQSLLSISDFALTYLDDVDADTFRATTGTNNAGNLTAGTLPSARLSGAYTGITGLGTLSSLTVSGITGAFIQNGTSGYLHLSPGNTTLPGFVAFYTKDNVRRGYVGWGNGDYLALYAENGWGWRVPSGTELRISGSLYTDTAPSFRVGTAFTQQVMDQFGWASGFPVWKRVIETDGSFSEYSYDANNGSLVAQVRNVTQAGAHSVPQLQAGLFSTSGAGNGVLASNTSALSTSRNTTGVAYHLAVYNPNGHIGGVSTSGTTTNFATTSDYRAKMNYEPIADAAARIAAIPVYRGEYRAAPGVTADYMLAHEVQPHVPEAVFGEKDAVDDAGEPVLQGMDYSKMVPLHHAALQELYAKIAALEARVAALESA